MKNKKDIFYFTLIGQLIVYLGLWLYNDYAAFYLSLVLGGIAFCVYFLSIIVDRIERSNVPQWYYQISLASILAPIIAWAIFVTLVGEMIF